MKNTEMTDMLNDLVKQSMGDIFNDNLEGVTVKTVLFTEIESDTDDGGVFGSYAISVNDTYILTVEASGVYSGFQDCWDGESHYTRDVQLDHIEDFEYEVVSVVNVNDKVDQMIEAEVDHE